MMQDKTIWFRTGCPAPSQTHGWNKNKKYKEKQTYWEERWIRCSYLPAGFIPIFLFLKNIQILSDRKMILFENLNVNLISNSLLRSAVALKKRREEKGEVFRNKSIDCFFEWILYFNFWSFIYGIHTVRKVQYSTVQQKGSDIQDFTCWHFHSDCFRSGGILMIDCICASRYEYSKHALRVHVGEIQNHWVGWGADRRAITRK